MHHNQLKFNHSLVSYIYVYLHLINNHIYLPYIVPDPTVSVTALTTQTVGESLALQYKVTIVRGITIRVDIVWSNGGIEFERIIGVSLSTVDNSLVYTAFYNISQLSTTDDGDTYECRVIVHGGSEVIAFESVRLNVTGK